jgi:hypothetical protein
VGTESRLLFTSMSQRIEEWLARFGLVTPLRQYVANVVAALPCDIREELIGDPAFQFSDYEPGTNVVAMIPVSAPGYQRPGRSVVLKRTLRHRPAAFIQYVIAHELAHAHLRNGGRWEGDDPENAADALAAEWGFARP